MTSNKQAEFEAAKEKYEAARRAWILSGSDFYPPFLEALREYSQAGFDLWQEDEKEREKLYKKP